MDGPFIQYRKNSEKRKRVFNGNDTTHLVYWTDLLVMIRLKNMHSKRKRKYMREMVNDACSLTEP